MLDIDAQSLLDGTRLVLAEHDDLVLVRLTGSDYDELLAFRAAIVESVANPEILRLMPEEESYVRESLAEKNFAIGLFRGDRLVAYNSQFWPVSDADLRELYIYGQTRPHAEPREITYAGGVMIDPTLRGTGLQKSLIEARRLAAYHVGRRHHFSTVSFANPFSWRNVIETGGRIIAIFDFEDPRYGPTSRMFLHQSPTPRHLVSEAVWVDPLDIAAQRALLASGHVGAHFRSAGDKTEIAYQRQVD